MSRLLKIIGAAIIGAGILIMLFPFVNSYKKQAEQKRMLNEIYALMKEQRSVTPTPTPFARATQTPEGYVPPVSNKTEYAEVGTAGTDSSGESSLNQNETVPVPTPTPPPTVDEEFTDLVLSEEEAAPTASVLESERLRGQRLFGIISIPDIDLTYAIVEGTSTENIGVAIGHFSASAAIGAEGNCALAGHRGGMSGPYFKDINKLQKGSEIILTDMNFEETKYYVTESFVVEPNETYVVKDLDVPGKYLTLVTCQDQGTRRLVVRAKAK